MEIHRKKISKDYRNIYLITPRKTLTDSLVNVNIGKIYYIVIINSMILFLHSTSGF